MDRFKAAGATGAMSAALWYGTGYVLKLPKPLWKPALFGFLGEFLTHYGTDPPQVAIDEKSGKAAAWWLPSQIGFWGKGGVRMVDSEKDYTRKRKGFTQAIISALISGIVWYVVARGFFGGGHKVAMWYAGIAAVTGGYGGYLKGDSDEGYRLPQGATYVSAKES